jgi:hypothetical protein
MHQSLFSLYREINLDEFSYDPAVRKRIQQYTTDTRNNGIRRSSIPLVYQLLKPFQKNPAQTSANFAGCHKVSGEVLLNNEYCQECVAEGRAIHE